MRLFTSAAIIAATCLDYTLGAEIPSWYKGQYSSDIQDCANIPELRQLIRAPDIPLLDIFPGRQQRQQERWNQLLMDKCATLYNALDGADYLSQMGPEWDLRQENIFRYCAWGVDMVPNRNQEALAHVVGKNYVESGENLLALETGIRYRRQQPRYVAITSCQWYASDS